MIAERPAGLSADWSWRRKAALIVFALIMAYLHSFYILGFYVSEMEYWGTVWIGVTAEQRLLSFGLALFANLGLMAIPFLRAPGRALRTVVALSLTVGVLISVAWLGHDLWILGLPEPGPLPSAEQLVIFVIDVLLFILPVLVRILYAVTICLNFWFLVNLARMPWPSESQ
jgi:hypothetical protein